MGAHISLGLDITPLRSRRTSVEAPWALCRRIIELQGRRWDAMQGLREQVLYHCDKRALGRPVERDMPTGTLVGQ